MHDARISVGLPGHPKTKKLIRRIGEGGAWRLVCLFLWVAQSRSDGDLSGMTGEDIELAADWQGEEGAFISALIEVGFIDGEEGSYAVHDWAEHNPWAAGAESRSEKARWLALCKHHGREEAAKMMPAYAAALGKAPKSTPEAPAKDAGSTDDSMRPAADDSATSMRPAENSSAPSPLPSPSTLTPSSFTNVQEEAPLSGRGLKRQAKTFVAWLDDVRASGGRAISEYRPVWDYAERVGIPDDWVELAWIQFRKRYSTDEKAKRKRYADWRRTFLNAVEGNWLGLWCWSDRDQAFRLTTVGVQADAADMREVA
jgi:hypothetical protein